MAFQSIRSDHIIRRIVVASLLPQTMVEFLGFMLFTEKICMDQCVTCFFRSISCFFLRSLFNSLALIVLHDFSRHSGDYQMMSEQDSPSDKGSIFHPVAPLSIPPLTKILLELRMTQLESSPIVTVPTVTNAVGGQLERSTRKTLVMSFPGQEQKSTCFPVEC